jgi:hypothetical protein
MFRIVHHFRLKLGSMAPKRDDAPFGGTPRDGLQKDAERKRDPSRLTSQWGGRIVALPVSAEILEEMHHSLAALLHGTSFNPEMPTGSDAPRFMPSPFTGGTESYLRLDCPTAGLGAGYGLSWSVTRTQNVLDGSTRSLAGPDLPFALGKLGCLVEPYGRDMVITDAEGRTLLLLRLLAPEEGDNDHNPFWALQMRQFADLSPLLGGDDGESPARLPLVVHTVRPDGDVVPNLLTLSFIDGEAQAEFCEDSALPEQLEQSPDPLPSPPTVPLGETSAPEETLFSAAQGFDLSPPPSRPATVTGSDHDGPCPFLTFLSLFPDEDSLDSCLETVWSAFPPEAAAAFPCSSIGALLTQQAAAPSFPSAWLPLEGAPDADMAVLTQLLSL